MDVAAGTDAGELLVDTEAQSAPSQRPLAQVRSERARRGTSISIGPRVLFFAFVSAAFVVFGASVLLPMLRDYARLLAEEQLLRDQVLRLEEKKAQLVHLAERMTSDPGTNEVFARIELGYQRPGETIVPVEPAGSLREYDAPVVDANLPLVPRHWPEWTHRSAQWASQRGLIAPFLDSELRGIWALLSGGLVVAAFVLFAPRRRRIEPQESIPSQN